MRNVNCSYESVTDNGLFVKEKYCVNVALVLWPLATCFSKLVIVNSIDTENDGDGCVCVRCAIMYERTRKHACMPRAQPVGWLLHPRFLNFEFVSLLSLKFILSCAFGS